MSDEKDRLIGIFGRHDDECRVVQCFDHRLDRFSRSLLKILTPQDTALWNTYEKPVRECYAHILGKLPHEPGEWLLIEPDFYGEYGIFLKCFNVLMCIACHYSDAETINAVKRASLRRLAGLVRECVRALGFLCVEYTV